VRDEHPLEDRQTIHFLLPHHRVHPVVRANEVAFDFRLRQHRCIVAEASGVCFQKLRQRLLLVTVRASQETTVIPRHNWHDWLGATIKIV
jgi:hypothetical protein